MFRRWCCRRGRARRACPARARCPACARGSAPRPAGCSSSGTPSAARGALAGVVVGRGADAAAGEHDVAAGEGALQVAVMRSGVVADVLGPGQLQAARGQQLDHLGQVLVGALADRISSPTMTRPKFMRRVQLGGGAASSAQCERRLRPGGEPASPRRSARAARSSAASAVVGEPERGKGEHQRVDPDRDRHQDRAKHAAISAPERPDAARRGAQVAGQHAHAEQRPAGARAERRGARRALACSASTSKAITR